MYQQFRSIVFLQILWLCISNGHKCDRVMEKNMKAILPSGDEMPLVGFGTYGVSGTENVKKVFDDALAAGYRLFDTAAIYGNEEDIGKALKELLPKHNLTRKDIFITSKLAPFPETMGNNAYAALEKAVKTIGCDYLDLFLIHFPGIVDYEIEKVIPNNYSTLRDETWQQLVNGVKSGLVRNIGVSNYNVRHLTELVTHDHGVKVAVNQVFWNPSHHKDDVLEFCRHNGILLQAYSSLGGSGSNNLVNHTEVKKIAEKLGKHPAQVLLRFAVQEHIAVIPRSLSKKHMESNIELDFVIPPSDMYTLRHIPQVKNSFDSDSII